MNGRLQGKRDSMKKRMKPDRLSVQSLHRLVSWSLLVATGAMMSIGPNAFGFTLDAAGSRREIIGSYGRPLEKYLSFHLEPSVPVLDSYPNVAGSGSYIRSNNAIEAYPSNDNNFKFPIIDRGGGDVVSNVTISVVSQFGNDVESEKIEKHASGQSALFLFGCGVLGLASLVRKKFLRVSKSAGGSSKILERAA